MSCLIREDIVAHLPIEKHERQVIEANRKMIELGIVRCDYRHAPDGMRLFTAAVHRMDARS